jgi:CRP-like cAMP-binding protein
MAVGVESGASFDIRCHCSSSLEREFEAPPMCLSASQRNLLLSRLPPADYQRLVARTHLVSLKVSQTLCKYRAPIESVYFPISGVASALMMMDDGNAIEVHTIGREGVVGQTVLFAGKCSPHEIVVQIPGTALRMDADVLEYEARRESPLGQLLLRHNLTYLMHISRSVACNGLHPIQQRFCRWLLITLDRMESDVIPFTHQRLGSILGVRRVSVTHVLRALQDKGLVKNRRGEITVLDRRGLEQLSCECYHKSRKEFGHMQS